MLIQDAVSSAAEFYQCVLGRTLTQATTILSSTTAQGCMLKEMADIAATQLPGLPDLNLLETAQSFSRPGPVYPLAMIGVKRLLDTADLQSLLTYGAALAAGNSAAPAFQNAFNQSLESFYQQFPLYRALPVPASCDCRL